MTEKKLSEVKLAVFEKKRSLKRSKKTVNMSKKRLSMTQSQLNLTKLMVLGLFKASQKSDFREN